MEIHKLLAIEIFFQKSGKITSNLELLKQVQNLV